MARQTAKQVAKAMTRDPHLAAGIERAYLGGVTPRTQRERKRKLKEELGKLGWESHFFHYEDESHGEMRYLVRGEIFAQFPDYIEEDEVRQKLEAIDLATSNFYMAIDVALEHESLAQAVYSYWDNVTDTRPDEVGRLASDLYSNLIEIYGIDLDDETTREYVPEKPGEVTAKKRAEIIGTARNYLYDYPRTTDAELIEIAADNNDVSQEVAAKVLREGSMIDTDRSPNLKRKLKNRLMR